MENKPKYSLPILKEVLLTKEFLNTLNACVKEENELIEWFKGLCSHFTKLITLLTDFHRKTNKTSEYKETLLLYLNQLLTNLSLIISILVQEAELDRPLKELRIFCKKQIIWSLDGIEETISKDFCPETKTSFINWMDIAFENINKMDFAKREEAIEIFNETHTIVEEVLSHAMSIAQITLEDDYKKIRGSCQSVLEAIGSLSSEINKNESNTAMLNLFVEASKNKLSALERRINTAILKLSLKVFSDYTLQLEKIHDFCFDKNNEDDHEKLDDLIADFDLHVDRILQIALFATSCSTCSIDCGKIRSCMASLEALETELVPAFTSVLLDPNINNIQLSLLLKDHWIAQVRVLQKLIYLIIDPYAFCEVIFDENSQILEKIISLVKSSAVIEKNDFEKLIFHSKVLIEFITVVMREEQEFNVPNVEKALSELKLVTTEVKAAFNTQPEKNIDNTRIIKRCKILLSVTKNLWNCFSNENQNAYEHEEEIKSVLSTEFTKDFDEIVARGQKILKERSVLNRTAGNNLTYKIPSSKLATESTSSLKLAHIRNTRFLNKKNDSNSNLCDILSELNNLTHTIDKNNLL